MVSIGQNLTNVRKLTLIIRSLAFTMSFRVFVFCFLQVFLMKKINEQMGKQGKGAKRRHNQHQQLVKFGVKRKVRITDIHIDLFVYLVGSFLGVEDVLNLVLTCRDFRSSIVNNLSTIRSYMDNLYSHCLAVCKSGLPCKLQRKFFVLVLIAC